MALASLRADRRSGAPRMSAAAAVWSPQPVIAAVASSLKVRAQSGDNSLSAAHQRGMDVMADLVGSGGSFGDEWSEVGSLFDLMSERPAWYASAACRTTPHAGSLTWFPEHQRDAKRAVAVCYRCPALGPCGAWSVAQGPLLKGIWGGMSERQRQRLRDTAR